MQDQDNNSSSDEERPLPSSILHSQRRGWAGSNLELDHQRESYGGEKKSQTAAVDLSQFRNEEVGKGYQAKHVVRQREVGAVAEGVVDMTGGAFVSRGDKEKSPKKHRKHDKKSSKRKRTHEEDDCEQRDSRLDSYLKCKGLKTFLDDIEKIISQDNSRRT